MRYRPPAHRRRLQEPRCSRRSRGRFRFRAAGISVPLDRRDGRTVTNPHYFTNTWVPSPRSLNRTDEPYLCAGRRAPDREFDAANRVDENDYRICGCRDRDVVFGNRRWRRELQRDHTAHRDGAGFHCGRGGQSASTRLRYSGLGASKPPEGELGATFGALPGDRLSRGAAPDQPTPKRHFFCSRSDSASFQKHESSSQKSAARIH